MDGTERLATPESAVSGPAAMSVVNGDDARAASMTGRIDMRAGGASVRAVTVKERSKVERSKRCRPDRVCFPWWTSAKRAVLVACLLSCAVNPAVAEDRHADTVTASIRPASPAAGAQLVRVLSLRDYNTRVVVLGVTCLGMAAGVIGSFAYLRKRAMLGDALSHATLPGIALMFILTGEKNLPLLLVGAGVAGVLGVVAALGLRYVPRVREDAAIGIVLSFFFGLGMVLFSVVQEMNTGNQAGLQSFIYGHAAGMIRRDAMLLVGVAGVVLLGSRLLYKEFRLVCFDQDFAAAQGWPVVIIDLLMMGLVVVTTVVGLQAVGLILVVAMLIIPAAAARFWTDDLRRMTILAGVFGAVSGWFGATLSALASRMPAGAIIVICAGVVFLASMLCAPHRGVIAGVLRRVSVRRRTVLQHLLRALAEFEERHGEGCAVAMEDLLAERSWTRASLARFASRAARRGLLARGAGRRLKLTPPGRVEARRVLRNHRLWELYLIKYADIAPSHVDRDADEIEHVLSEPVVQELERTLADERAIPPSPHPRGAPA